VEVGVISDWDDLVDLISFWVSGHRARHSTAASEAIELTRAGGVLIVELTDQRRDQLLDELTASEFDRPAVLIAPAGTAGELATSGRRLAIEDDDVASIEAALLINHGAP
jgi:hypothetical protein